jgi:antitoxin CptB
MRRENAYMRAMLPDEELRRLHWRAHHRGTREADMMIGGFFDAHHASWGSDERALFAELLDEQDVDIMAWAIGTAEVPERFEGSMMEALKRRDYIRIAR